jgi:hypothetical protein
VPDHHRGAAAGQRPTRSDQVGVGLQVRAAQLVQRRGGDAPAVRVAVGAAVAGEVLHHRRDPGVAEPLREGERVKITVEVPRSGYLYVFDREVYADRSLGDPYLIFPTTAIRGGDNLVKAGRVIEIPSSEDKPPFYTIKKSRPDYEGELLTVLITQAPLAELPLGPGALKLPKEQVSSYEKRWAAAVDNIELVGGPGTPMTAAEKKAAEGRRLLTRSDPMPQSIYRVRSKPGEPLLLSFFLRIKPQSQLDAGH